MREKDYVEITCNLIQFVTSIRNLETNNRYNGRGRLTSL